MPGELLRSSRRLVGFGLAIVAAVGLSGCFTGERPTLAEAPTTTGDAATDAVLQRLDTASAAVFTADYDVLTKFGGVSRPASVVQAGPARRSVTVGVDPLPRRRRRRRRRATSRPTSARTTLDVARISDTQLSADFFARSAATRLRRDANARTGDTIGSTVEIAGQPADLRRHPAVVEHGDVLRARQRAAGPASTPPTCASS